MRRKAASLLCEPRFKSRRQRRRWRAATPNRQASQIVAALLSALRRPAEVSLVALPLYASCINGMLKHRGKIVSPAQRRRLRRALAHWGRNRETFEATQRLLAKEPVYEGMDWGLGESLTTRQIAGFLRSRGVDADVSGPSEVTVRHTIAVQHPVGHISIALDQKGEK